MKKEEVGGVMESIGIKEGEVMELKSVKELGEILQRSRELHEWWKVAMGYRKGHDAPWK